VKWVARILFRRKADTKYLVLKAARGVRWNGRQCGQVRSVVGTEYYPRGASGAVILSIIRTLIIIFLLVSPFFCYQFTHKKRTLRRVNELLIINY